MSIVIVLQLWFEKSLTTILTAGTLPESSWEQWAEAYAWQILVIEAYTTPRSIPPTLSPMPPRATSDNATRPACWTIIDRLVGHRGEKLGDAIRRCSSDLGVERKLVKNLVMWLQACYLELGACCLGGVLGEGSTADDTLPVSGLMKQVGVIQGVTQDWIYSTLFIIVSGTSAHRSWHN